MLVLASGAALFGLAVPCWGWVVWGILQAEEWTREGPPIHLWQKALFAASWVGICVLCAMYALALYRCLRAGPGAAVTIRPDGAALSGRRPEA
jgi:hypothetical protein